MLEAVSAMTDVPKDKMELGIDGCGVPVFGMPIDRLALAYARLGSPEGLVCSSVRTLAKELSMRSENILNYLAGSDRFDTRLIEVTKGRIIGKMGAEGIFALTMPDQAIRLRLQGRRR